MPSLFFDANFNSFVGTVPLFPKARLDFPPSCRVLFGNLKILSGRRPKWEQIACASRQHRRGLHAIPTHARARSRSLQALANCTPLVDTKCGAERLDNGAQGTACHSIVLGQFRMPRAPSDTMIRECLEESWVSLLGLLVWKITCPC